MLTGCGATILNYYREPSASVWHSRDLSSYLQKNHPIGSDEGSLIEDFTAHGYRLDGTSELRVDGSCSLFFGAQQGVVIRWTSDTNRKILGYGYAGAAATCTLSL